MSEQTFNPEDVRAMVGASTTTIRNWCRQFAEFLSAGANPTPGQERKLTAADVATLQQVKLWRDMGLSMEEIGRRLEEGDAIAVPKPAAIDVAPTAQSQPPQEAVLPYAALELLIEGKIERRLKAELASRQAHQKRDMWIFAAGVAAGVLLAAAGGGLWVAYLMARM